MKVIIIKDHQEIDDLANLLPERIIHENKPWGLRIKREQGKWFVRYVTKHASPKARTDGRYASIEAKGSQQLHKAIVNMLDLAKLLKLKDVNQ